MAVLIIEDYEPLCKSPAKGLREAGFAVKTRRDDKKVKLKAATSVELFSKEVENE